MEFSDLVGEHVLDAVNRDVSGQANQLIFRLDGVIYAAEEDENDGYRSSCKDLQVIPDREMENTFPGECVVGTMDGSGGSYRGYTNDILTLISVKTGKAVLRAGTANTYDYYPSFVDDFMPENLSANASAPGSASTSAQD